MGISPLVANGVLLFVLMMFLIELPRIREQTMWQQMKSMAIWLFTYFMGVFVPHVLFS